MHKSNLGISHRPSNVVSFLITKFNLIYDRYHYVNDGKNVSNFDTFLFFDDDIETYNRLSTIFDNSNIRYIGGPRFPKIHQYMILYKNGINVPRFWGSTSEYFGDPRIDEILSIVDCDDAKHLVIKSNNGARGIGQILLKKFEISEFFKDSMNRDLSYEDYLKKWETTMGGGDNLPHTERIFLRDSIQAGNFFITEKINHIAEYRIIYIASDPYNPLVIKRDVSANWQANTAITHIGTEIEFSDIKHHGFNSTRFLEDLNKLATLYKFPFLSTDVYILPDGQYGFFEFQMQFGYDKMNKSKLPEKIISSVDILLK